MDGLEVDPSPGSHVPAESRPADAPRSDSLDSTLPRKRAGRVVAAVLIAGVFVLLGARLFVDLDRETFHGDESWWLFYARSFRQALHLDFASRDWSGDLAIDQPSLGKVVFGLPLWVAGKLDEIPEQPWDFSSSPEWNQATGRMPKPDVLYVGRLTSAALALLAAGVVFAIACRISGFAAGVIAVLLLALNPLFVRCGRRAMPDTALLFFVLLGVDLAIRFVRRLNSRNWRRAALLAFGVWAAGFAATGTKLNGAVLFAIFAAAGLYVLAHSLAVRRLERPRLVLALLGPAGATAFGAVLFAVSNPVVLTSPVAGARRMFEHRALVSHMQASLDPDLAEQGGEVPLGDRWQRLVTRTLIGPASEGNFPTLGRVGVIPLDLIAFLLGLIAIVVSEGISWRVDGLPSGRGVALLAFAALFATSLLAVGLDWDRYYLPALPAIALASAFLPGEVARIAARLPRPAA